MNDPKGTLKGNHRLDGLSLGHSISDSLYLPKRWCFSLSYKPGRGIFWHQEPPCPKRDCRGTPFPQVHSRLDRLDQNQAALVDKAGHRRKSTPGAPSRAPMRETCLEGWLVGWLVGWWVGGCLLVLCCLNCLDGLKAISQAQVLQACSPPGRVLAADGKERKKQRETRRKGRGRQEAKDESERV